MHFIVIINDAELIFISLFLYCFETWSFNTIIESWLRGNLMLLFETKAPQSLIQSCVIHELPLIAGSRIQLLSRPRVSDFVYLLGKLAS